MYGEANRFYTRIYGSGGVMSKKIMFTINTNGTFLAENAERIVRDKWTAIFISLTDLKM